MLIYSIVRIIVTKYWLLHNLYSNISVGNLSIIFETKFFMAQCGLVGKKRS